MTTDDVVGRTVDLVGKTDVLFQGNSLDVCVRALITFTMFFLETNGIDRDEYCEEILKSPLPSEIMGKELKQCVLPFSRD